MPIDSPSSHRGLADSKKPRHAFSHHGADCSSRKGDSICYVSIPQLWYVKAFNRKSAASHSHMSNEIQIRAAATRTMASPNEDVHLHLTCSREATMKVAPEATAASTAQWRRRVCDMRLPSPCLLWRRTTSVHPRLASRAVWHLRHLWCAGIISTSTNTSTNTGSTATTAQDKRQQQQQ